MSNQCVCGHDEAIHYPTRNKKHRKCAACGCPEFFSIEQPTTSNQPGKGQTMTFNPQPTKTARTVKSNKPPKGELPGMPEIDDLGKAGLKFKTAIFALDRAKEEKDEAAEELMMEMRRAKRFVLTVEGCTLELTHQSAKDIIKVRKPA